MGGRGRSGSSDHWQTTLPVSATGIIGASPNFQGYWNIKSEGKIRLDTTGADASVEIDIEVRVGNTDNWIVLDTHVGSLNEEYKVLSWDFMRLNCRVFAGNTFTIYGSGYFLVDADVDLTETGLALEETQLAILQKICDLQQSEDAWDNDGYHGAASSGSESTFFSYTLAAGETIWLTLVKVSCNKAGKMTILEGTDVKGAGRTEAQKPSDFCVFYPGKKFVAGETIDIKFEQYRGTNGELDIDVYGIRKT
jgi:hypothetical protein